MGNSSSTTSASLFNKSVTNTVLNSLSQTSQTNTSIITGTQTLNISNINCGGPVVISGVNQTMSATINTNALAKSVDQNQLTAMLQNAVKQATNADQTVKSDFMGGGASASDSTTTYNTNVQKVAASFTYQDFLNTLQQVNTAQSANFSNISSSSYCTLKDISQNMSFNLISKSIGDKLTQAYLNLQNTNDISQSQTSKQDVSSTGPISDLLNLFSGPFGMIMVAVIASVVFIIIIVIAFRMSGSHPRRILPQIPPFSPGGYGAPNPYMQSYPPAPTPYPQSIPYSGVFQ
jgi:hypothetical protein